MQDPNNTPNEAQVFEFDTALDPVITNIDPADGELFDTGSPSFTVDAESDPQLRQLTNVEGEIVAGGSGTASASMSGTTDSQTDQFSGLSSGAYTAEFVGTDDAGTESNPVTRTFTVDNSAPTVSIDSPTNGSPASIDDTEDLPVEVTVDGDPDEHLDVTLEFTPDGSGTVTATESVTIAINAAGDPVTQTITIDESQYDPADETVYDLSATVEDPAGNTGNDNENLAVTITDTGDAPDVTNVETTDATTLEVTFNEDVVENTPTWTNIEVETSGGSTASTGQATGSSCSGNTCTVSLDTALTDAQPYELVSIGATGIEDANDANQDVNSGNLSGGINFTASV